MGRLLLVRLARRPGHRPLTLPRKVRAWADSRIDFGGRVAQRRLIAVRVGRCIIRARVQLCTISTNAVNASMQLRTLLLTTRVLTSLLHLRPFSEAGDRDLEHG